MKILYLTLSAKQVGILYHKTSKEAVLEVLKSGNLCLSVGRGAVIEQKHASGKNYFASFTRSRFGGYHWGDDGNSSLYNDTEVLITVDGNLLSEREKFVPIDYWEQRGKIKTDGGYHPLKNKEVEERLVSNKAEIPFLKSIIRVDFIQRGVHGRVEDYGADKGKYKVMENERHQNLLGSIVLRLKTNKIPYGFYDSFKDWASRKEYSYTGKKDVNVNTLLPFTGKQDYQKLKILIQCISNLPYEKLDKDAKDYVRYIYTYLSSTSDILFIYNNYRKPSASPAIRKLTLKVARIIQKANFKSEKEIQQFIAKKYEIVVLAKQRRQRDIECASNALTLIEVLTIKIEDWDTSNNLFLEDIKELKSSSGYSYTKVSRTIKYTLESELPEVAKLKKVMSDLNITESLAIYIYYEIVAPYNLNNFN